MGGMTMEFKYLRREREEVRMIEVPTAPRVSKHAKARVQRGCAKGNKKRNPPSAPSPKFYVAPPKRNRYAPGMQ